MSFVLLIQEYHIWVNMKNFNEVKIAQYSKSRIIVLYSDICNLILVIRTP